MRKMAKGIAVTGGVFCIISLLLRCVSMASSIFTYTRYGSSEMISSLLISTVPTLLTLVFLAVVLFRGKADVFSGVVFILLGVYSLVLCVGSIAAVSSYIRYGMSSLPLILGMVGNLLRGVLYILMAVHCLRKNAGKTPLYGIGFVIVAILSVAQSVTQYTSTGVFSGDTMAALAIVIPAAIGAIIGALPLVLAGFAVGNAKPAAPAWQPQQDWQPQYQQNWQQPQYQQPQQNWQQPQYQQPQQNWQQPQYQQPQQNWQQPQYQAPQQDWQQPQYQAPQQDWQAPQQASQQDWQDPWQASQSSDQN